MLRLRFYFQVRMYFIWLVYIHYQYSLNFFLRNIISFRVYCIKFTTLSASIWLAQITLIISITVLSSRSVNIHFVFSTLYVNRSDKCAINNRFFLSRGQIPVNPDDRWWQCSQVKWANNKKYKFLTPFFHFSFNLHPAECSKIKQTKELVKIYSKYYIQRGKKEEVYEVR